ncbi:restriction endonuclease [Vibrio splendidus]|nr:restriction endonuclease [Vibrio splendidus]
MDLELPKPFLLLAGISGTGKTRFVRKQVEATGSLSDTYCLTSVRPDWHEPSDLLGYVSRLSKDGQAEYITTDVLRFIAKAWRGIFDCGLSVQVHSNEQRGERLVVTGDSQTQQKIRPYWLCLDEMNLAPVEQYFADYLSVLETRRWSWDNDQFTYSSDPLLKPLALGLANEKGHTGEVYDRKLRSSLGFDDDKYDELWQLFCQYGLGIPFNLIVAGTVNMDETTHGFSRKVIDRALSIDFGEFFPNDIDEFFEAKKQPLTLGYPKYSQAKLALFSQVEADSTAEKTKEFFLSVNAVLKGSAFELAYRAFNELCLSVISFSPKDEDELAAVFDDFLMCKILPRVEGDEDKLTMEDGGALLEKLVEVLSNQSTLKAIWDGERADLLRQNIEDKDTPIKVSCRSKIKLEYMQSKLQSGFTSFWP